MDRLFPDLSPRLACPECSFDTAVVFSIFPIILVPNLSGFMEKRNKSIFF